MYPCSEPPGRPAARPSVAPLSFALLGIDRAARAARFNSFNESFSDSRDAEHARAASAQRRRAPPRSLCHEHPQPSWASSASSCRRAVCQQRHAGRPRVGAADLAGGTHPDPRGAARVCRAWLRARAAGVPAVRQRQSRREVRRDQRAAGGPDCRSRWVSGTRSGSSKAPAGSTS